jgi:uncharacterized membrane protein YfcA
LTLLVGFGLLATVFVTSFISGIFGMAGGMILLWVLLLIMPVASAIAVHGIIQVVANGSRAWFTRRYIEWRVLTIIVAGVLLAALLLLVVRYEPSLLLVYFVIGALPVLIWIPRRWLHLDVTRPSHALACGLVTGGLNLSVGLSGPTFDIFFIHTSMDRRAIIATKAATQVISHATKVLFYAGLATETLAGDWMIIAFAAPVAVLGTRAGNIVLEKMSDARFRQWTRGIVTVIGLVYLARGIELLF